MFVKSNLKAVLALGLAIIGSSVHAGERVEGPLISAGLWEVSRRSVVFEWQEYPNTVIVIHKDSKEVVCEGGVRQGGAWIRDVDGPLIMVGVGTHESGLGTTSLTVYSGDFSRRYFVDNRYETFGFGLAVGASNMSGRPAAVHHRSEATRIGDCPADMKPGETRKIEPSQ